METHPNVGSKISKNLNFKTSFVDAGENLSQTASFKSRIHLSSQFLPILNLLWIFGQCPLLISKDSCGTHTTTATSKQIVRVSDFWGWKHDLNKKNLNFEEFRKAPVCKCNKVKFEFKICNRFRFAYCALSAVFFTLVFTLGLLQLGGLKYQLFQPSNLFPDVLTRWDHNDVVGLGKLPHYIIGTFEVVFALQVILEYFICWMKMPELPNWLNGWNRIETAMEKLLKLSNDNDPLPALNMTRFVSNLKWYFVWGPSLLLVSMVVFGDLQYKFPLYFLLQIVHNYAVTLVKFADDAQVLLMIRSIELAFKQMREIVISQYGSGSDSDVTNYISTHGGASLNEMRSWRKILVDIRHQAWLCGRFIAPQQLLSLLLTIYFEAAALFVTATLLSLPQYDVAVLVVVMAYTLVNTGKTYLKIYMAVRVTQEERNLTHLIKQMEMAELRKDCNEELGSIHLMLSNEPTEISLSGFISLNNSLFLSIIGQVCTLFIVLMQFQAPK